MPKLRFLGMFDKRHEDNDYKEKLTEMVCTLVQAVLSEDLHKEVVLCSCDCYMSNNQEKFRIFKDFAELTSKKPTLALKVAYCKDFSAFYKSLRLRFRDYVFEKVVD